MDAIEMNMLRQVAELEKIPSGAYNIRLNGESAGRNSTANIDIVPKTDKSGIDIFVKDNTVNESMHIPVILSQTGLKETVYNDFYIGENCDIVIVAGCGIHNCGGGDSEHSGIHSFHIGKNSHVKYVERHYGEGDGIGGNIMNPTTEVELAENAFLEMETAQIKGVDSADRTTKARLAAGATLTVSEKIMTHGTQYARTNFIIDLDGPGATCHAMSRSVATEDSTQTFISDMRGNSACNGRTECDAIIMDNGRVSAIPKVSANHPDASLVHEAAIGKIAGEQLIKLMTLGLTEKQAEQEIVNGFLK